MSKMVMTVVHCNKLYITRESEVHQVRQYNLSRSLALWHLNHIFK